LMRQKDELHLGFEKKAKLFRYPIEKSHPFVSNRGWPGESIVRRGRLR
jgi:hypothetical protein